MSESNALGGVLYSDGGARPNPGNAGWGVHGYLYQVDVEVKKPGKYNVPTREGYVETFTATSEETPVKIINYVDGFGSLFNQSNNVAELIGFKRCLEFIKTNQLTQALIYLDSKYVLEGITIYYKNWQQNGWVNSYGKPVSNLSLWQEVNAIYEELNERMSLKLDWTKGHIGELGNTRADELATRGVFAAANGQVFEEMKVSEVAGYLSPKIEFNPLFTKNRWYFISGQDEPEQLPDGRFLYYTGYHGKPATKKSGVSEDEEDENFSPPDSINWGVAQPDTYLGLVVVREREPVIDKMQHLHNERCDTELQRLVCGQLSTILTAKTYGELKEYGGLFLQKNPVHNQVDLPNGDYITWEVRPPRRSYTVHETFSRLRSLLMRYFDGGLTRTDITSLIYETTQKGKKAQKTEVKVKDSIPASIKYLDIDVNVPSGNNETLVVPLRLTLNIDMPIRAHLQRITKEGKCLPTVNVITWRESKDAFRYAVVIECDGELLFWVATDRNLRLLRK